MDDIAIREWIATELRGQIGRLNLSRREVARRAHIDHVILSRRLIGAVSFSVEEFIIICAVLDVSAPDLLLDAAEAGLSAPSSAKATAK
jgi:transcriptional regulator with XRE-family HTH domain